MGRGERNTLSGWQASFFSTLFFASARLIYFVIYILEYSVEQYAAFRYQI